MCLKVISNKEEENINGKVFWWNLMLHSINLSLIRKIYFLKFLGIRI